MKNLFIITAAASLLLSSCASEFDITEADVPQIVKDAFKTKYPNATASEWEVEKSEGRLVFEAEFKMDGKNKEAEFKPDGTFIKEE
jgi:uncharacterized membrane protein YkoI